MGKAASTQSPWLATRHLSRWVRKGNNGLGVEARGQELEVVESRDQSRACDPDGLNARHA
jgi:hypothetical protein